MELNQRIGNDMTAIAWAIVVATILNLPEDKGLKVDAQAFTAGVFVFSSVWLVICTIRELLR